MLPVASNNPLFTASRKISAPLKRGAMPAFTLQMQQQARTKQTEIIAIQSTMASFHGRSASGATRSRVVGKLVLSETIRRSVWATAGSAGRRGACCMYTDHI